MSTISFAGFKAAGYVPVTELVSVPEYVVLLPYPGVLQLSTT